MRPTSTPHATQLVEALIQRLDALATDKSRDFWERYMKGVIPFRGVPMALIRKAVHVWWHDDGPAALSATVRKQLALMLFEGGFGEDKLAGTLVLHELLLHDLTLHDLSSLESLFDRELIADWNTCDWFCVKVLGNLVARDLPSRNVAHEVASWSNARTLWQRRAANVAFVNLAKQGEANFEGFTTLMLDTCDQNLRCTERFAQTGVGWLLRELAETEEARVLAFTEAHVGIMSREAIRSVTERMPKNVQAQLLAAHQRTRATS
jgi:3-methyladenine DNA glycosylase AlkD